MVMDLQNPQKTFPNFPSWRFTDKAVLLKVNQSRHFSPKENKLLNDVTERQSQEVLSENPKGIEESDFFVPSICNFDSSLRKEKKYETKPIF